MNMKINCSPSRYAANLATFLLAGLLFLTIAGFVGFGKTVYARAVGELPQGARDNGVALHHASLRREVRCRSIICWAPSTGFTCASKSLVVAATMRSSPFTLSG